MKIQLPGDSWLEIWSDDYNALKSFVNFVIPWVIDERGIQQDNSKFKRWKNAQELLVKAKNITADIDEQLKEPPLKISMPLLENASLEDEEELQDKWANLLANSLTQKKDIKPAYIEILKELSSIEVKILDKIYDDAKLWWWVLTDVQFSSEAISKIFLSSIDDMRVIVDNLFRLRLAEAPAMINMSAWGYHPVLKTNDIFQITFLWIKFIEACKFTK